MAQEGPSQSIALSLMELVGHLAWPITILVIVCLFRRDFHALLKKLALANTVKLGLAEFTFQTHTRTAIGTAVAAQFMPQLGPDGFLTNASLVDAVELSGLCDEAQPVEGLLQIFQTPSQRTWLALAGDFVFIVLDDESTRARKSLVQDFFERKDCLPIECSSTEESGSVKFAANETWWYYSLHIFPHPAMLETAVGKLIGS